MSSSSVIEKTFGPPKHYSDGPKLNPCSLKLTFKCYARSFVESIRYHIVLHPSFNVLMDQRRSAMGRNSGYALGELALT